MDNSRWKYDVFVSFRGDDTRNAFASHLFKQLDQEGYTYFRDTDEENRGMVIESVLLEAIHHSMAALIVFSRNYADSPWCLNELVEILECNERWRKEGHLVLPIFYDVEPGEVRRQSGMFGEGFERCKMAMGGDVERIEKWKTALVEAGNLSGWHSRNDANGDEADFIRKITTQLASQRFPAKRRRMLETTEAIAEQVHAAFAVVRAMWPVARVVGLAVLVVMALIYLYGLTQYVSFSQIAYAQFKEIMERMRRMEDVELRMNGARSMEFDLPAFYSDSFVNISKFKSNI